VTSRRLIALLLYAAIASPAHAQDAADPLPAPPAGDDTADNAVEEGEAAGELPRVEDVPLPEAEERLTGPRRDWLILKDGRLLVVEPVFPRPDTLKRIQDERNAILADLNRRASPEGKARLEELFRLTVFVPDDGASAEYRIRVEDLREIVHHEEMMLRRADRLLDDGDTRKAFELLFVVARTDPNWPGLEERQTRLTFADAERLLDEKDGERALVFLESLYERQPPPDGADRLLALAADLLVGEPAARDDGRQARAQLARVRRLDPRHPAVARWTTRLAERARALRISAEQSSAQGDHSAASAFASTAAKVWPKLDGLKPVHARLTRRYQVLTVGVLRIAPAAPVALGSLAEERISRLTAADLFEIDAFGTSPSYRSAYFEQWEPTDLGRRARFKLRPTLPAWAARRPVTASDAVRILADRIRPGEPAFDGRFADLVTALRATGPYEFEVVFSHIPPRTEAILARVPSFGGGAAPPPEVMRRFAETQRNGNRVVYRRSLPERSAEPHLAEVVEVAYPSYEQAAQAADRGDVRMLAEVPAWDVLRLRSDKRFTVTGLAVPVTHVLQFHPSSEPFKSTELRRAFAASSDASALLRIVAGEAAADAGRLVTAPYPSTHRGYDPLVQPRTPDLALALALTLAAERVFGGQLPELVFASPAEGPGRKAAESLAATWKRIGLPVRLATFDELGTSGRWDVAYRELTVPDPAAALGPLVTLDPTGDVARLTDLPDWLRQRLLDLERATDPTTAEAILIDLHRLLYADVRCVPLFEVDRFVAVRGALEGLPERPVTVYQNAERWTLLPDFPEESP